MMRRKGKREKQEIKPQKQTIEEQTIIEKKYLNKQFPLGEKQHEFLAYDNIDLVPCELHREKDYFTLKFDCRGLADFASAKDLKEYEKYMLLANIADLQQLCNLYSFSLAPENVKIDVRLRAKILERNVQGEAQMFLQEYKALTASLLQDQYKFEDYLRGGGDLFGKREDLKKIKAASSVAQIRELLLDLAKTTKEAQQKEYTQINRKKAERNKKLIPILAAATVIALLLSGYLFFIRDGFNRTLIEANDRYLAKDYTGVMDTLEDTNIDRLPLESKYIAAQSSVITEGLTDQQRKNILSKITLQTDKRYLNYWIAVGRLDFDEAQDYAKQLGDNELLLYALAKEKATIEDDSSLSGDEKATRTAELDKQIEELRKELAGSDNTLNEDSEDQEDSTQTEADPTNSDGDIIPLT